jgi:putative ATP-dependent endonuclease of OLD family
MHISRVSLVNYRNFERATIRLDAGVNTIIGENGSGKSNLFRAIRLLLDERLVSRQHDLREDDFHRGLSSWRGHWIVIRIEFSGVSNDEAMQSLLLQHTAEESSGKGTEHAAYSLIFRPKLAIRSALSAVAPGDYLAMKAVLDTISISDYEKILVGKTRADLTDPGTYAAIVGDFDKAVFPKDENGNAPEFRDEVGVRVVRELSLWREFSLSYIPALRDVVADFSDSRRNPLRTLLAAKSEEIVEGEFDSILAKVIDLNNSIEDREDVKEVAEGILRTFKETVGEVYSPTTMQIHSELPLTAADLFRSLQLYVGENGEVLPRKLQEMSLGGANLVYLTLKLLEFDYRSRRQALANFLLIEEPEAHIHTHVQKTLFDRVSFTNTQIIYSTHSSQISEVSDIERVNVLSREGSRWLALQPANGLSKTESAAAQRFLDAVRSNLLFARSVVLIEGDAEEILLPALIKDAYGISLDEIGISLVNVRSTGFHTLARLFHTNRLRKRCAIATDHDQTYFNTVVVKGDDEKVTKRKNRAVASAKAGESRRQALLQLVDKNDYLHLSLAPHTFEVDFANTGPASRTLLKSVVFELYKSPKRRSQARIALDSSSIEDFGLQALLMANGAKKGWFALLLSQRLGRITNVTGQIVPDYLLDAIGFAANDLPAETWQRVIAHRLSFWDKSLDVSWYACQAGHATLASLRAERISVAEALDELKTVFPDEGLIALGKAFKK